MSTPLQGSATSARVYRIVHRTTYRYGTSMTDGYTIACLTPRDTPYQRVLDADIEVEPAPSSVMCFDDVFGNHLTRFGLHEPHDRSEFVAVSRVAIEQRPRPLDDTPWEDVVAMLDAAALGEAVEIGMLRSSSKLIDLDALREPLRAIADEVFAPGRGIVELAEALNRLIFTSFEFDAEFSSLSTPLDEVLAERRGVCQDFAHLAVAVLRTRGLAARYVSGYIETMPPPGEERLIGADASHAWVAVWTPNAGWVDFDPTNGHLPTDEHITIGWGREYSDVPPLRGVVIGPSTDQTLDVSVDVTRG